MKQFTNCVVQRVGALLVAALFGARWSGFRFRRARYVVTVMIAFHLSLPPPSGDPLSWSKKITCTDTGTVIRSHSCDADNRLLFDRVADLSSNRTVLLLLLLLLLLPLRETRSRITERAIVARKPIGPINPRLSCRDLSRTDPCPSSRGPDGRTYRPNPSISATLSQSPSSSSSSSSSFSSSLVISLDPSIVHGFICIYLFLGFATMKQKKIRR